MLTNLASVLAIMPSVNEVEVPVEEEFSDCVEEIVENTSDLKLNEPVVDEKFHDWEEEVQTETTSAGPGGKWYIDEINLKEIEEFLEPQELEVM